MVNNMNILGEQRPAQKFVDYMHKHHTTLNVFVRLFCMWSKLSSDERQEVYDICLLNHPQLYNGMIPDGDEDEDSGDT